MTLSSARARSSRSRVRLPFLLSLALATAVGGAVVLRAAGRQGDGTAAIAKAFFEALASGSPERFEAMAKERYTPAFLARRTADDRRQFLERVRGDFGTMTLGAVQAKDDTLSLKVTGSTGLEGRIDLTLEPDAPHRITSLRVEVGGPGEERAPSTPPPPIDAGMPRAELERALDGYLASRAAADAFAGTVAIAKDGEVVFERAYGPADRDAKRPVRTATRFNVASIGKAFTRTAIGQLIAQKRLSLSDTLGTLLPDYPNADARPATVAQLLEHQAGIADFFGPAFDAAPKSGFASNADYYRFVSTQPQQFAPGARRQYCNGCYVVLGQIIERVTGQKYEQYIAEHVFAPAGMRTAAFLRSDVASDDRAELYSRQLPGTSALANARDAHGVTGSAAGGAYATAADLLAFDRALREGKLLDAKMTAWFLGGEPAAPGTRAAGAYGIAGGAPGTNALLESDDHWAVAVVGNLDPPAAIDVGQAIKRQLSR